MNTDELPEGWTTCELGELGEWAGGGTPTTGVDEYWDGGSIPWISAKDMKLDYLATSQDTITEKGRIAARLTLLPVGSLLMVVRGMILARRFPVAVTTAAATINQDLRAIIPSAAVDCRFLLRALQLASNAFVQATGEATHGTRRLETHRLKEWPVPLPPFAEQRRIVAAVERILGKVTAARARLDRVPTTLKRFRQAVLAAACSDRLTADWREKNPSAPDTVRVWIAGIHRARQGTLEGRKLDKLGTPLLEPKHDGESTGWVTTRIGDIPECLDHLRRPVRKDGRGAGSIPYYGANGRTGWIDKHLFDEELVLVVEDETFVGREIPFSYVIRGKSWVNNHAHILRPLGGMSAELLNVLSARYDFVPLTSGTTGRRKLVKSALIGAPISVAPLAEQQEIVKQVSALFARADAIEAMAAKHHRLKRIRSGQAASPRTRCEEGCASGQFGTAASRHGIPCRYRIRLAESCPRAI